MTVSKGADDGRGYRNMCKIPQGADLGSTPLKFRDLELEV